MRRDLACAVSGLALALAAWLAARALPTSLLSDGVGADGVPKLLAGALAAVSLWIGTRALLRRAGAADEPAARHLRALGVAALGFAYAACAPFLGYPLALALLLGAAALYYGASARPQTALFAVAGAFVLWLVFARMLGVAMPGGLFY